MGATNNNTFESNQQIISAHSTRRNINNCPAWVAQGTTQQNESAQKRRPTQVQSPKQGTL